MLFFDGLPCTAIAYVGLSAVDEGSVPALADFVCQQRLDKQNSSDFVVGVGFLITHAGLYASQPPTSRQVTPRQLARILKNYDSPLFSIAHYVPESQLNLTEEIGLMA